MKPTDVARLKRGLRRGESYRALGRMFRVFHEPVEALRRYVRSEGNYPWTTKLRTPTGTATVTLGHAHDVRTVNEILCRSDYGSSHPRVVVDIGANIGIASVYFLSRRPDSVVYAWEPVPHNLRLARQNLAPFADREHLHERAMAPTSGPATFMVEGVGRYSGLSAYYEHVGLETEEVTVQCDAVADALTEVIAKEGRIDLIKIDTEGSERSIVEAIPHELLPQIGEIRFEDAGDVRVCTGAELLRQGSVGGSRRAPHPHHPTEGTA